MTLYYQTKIDLLSAIKNYKNGVIDLDAFKCSIWKAASEVVAVEEKEFRLFLQQAEGELDSLQFTIDDNLLFDETVKVANRIESYLLRL